MCIYKYIIQLFETPPPTPHTSISSASESSSSPSLLFPLFSIISWGDGSVWRVIFVDDVVVVVVAAVVVGTVVLLVGMGGGVAVLVVFVVFIVVVVVVSVVGAVKGGGGVAMVPPVRRCSNASIFLECVGNNSLMLFVEEILFESLLLLRDRAMDHN